MLAKQVTVSSIIRSHSLQAAVRFISAFSATLATFKERLSLVYVLNDVLYHATNTSRDTKAFVASAAVQHLPALVRSVKSAPNYRVGPLDRVLGLWSEKRYFSDEEFAQIAGEQIKQTIAQPEIKEPERIPLVKPEMLGSDGDPHWLLPVSCMVEVMVLRLSLRANNRNIHIITSPFPF